MLKTVNTYTATISMGLRLGYTEGYWSAEIVQATVMDYVNEHKFGATFSTTTFIYPGGSEPGVLIGLINYPRAPLIPLDIRINAIELAKVLREKYKQERVTIVFPDLTMMLCDEEPAK